MVVLPFHPIHSQQSINLPPKKKDPAPSSAPSVGAVCGLEPSKGGENRQDSCKGSEKQHLGVAADLGPIQRWDNKQYVYIMRIKEYHIVAIRLVMSDLYMSNHSTCIFYNVCIYIYIYTICVYIYNM